MRPFGYALLGAAVSVGLAACGGGYGGRDIPPLGADDPVMGDPDAPVEIIEYASTSCSHCAEFAENILPQLKEKYIDTGQVKYSVRELITEPASYAAAGFILARCAPEDRYFNVLDAVFRAQEAAFTTGDLRSPLVGVALASGMSQEEFDACMNDAELLEEFNARVAKNFEDSDRQGTPIIYINGVQPFPSGVPAWSTLDEAIQGELDSN
jgi:protein-disulfide isomerase